MQPTGKAVTIYLDGVNLTEDVYREYDVVTLEDQLIWAVAEQELGSYDGNEFGPDAVALFLDGPDPERLYAGIKPVLEQYPLCRNARVFIRAGSGVREERISLTV